MNILTSILSPNTVVLRYCTKIDFYERINLIWFVEKAATKLIQSVLQIMIRDGLFLIDLSLKYDEAFRNFNRF